MGTSITTTDRADRGMKKMNKYYIDNYSSGTPRNIVGPYSSLREARKHVEGVKVSIDPYEGVVAELRANGSNVSLVEAWARSADAEDYQAIYAVS